MLSLYRHIFRVYSRFRNLFLAIVRRVLRALAPFFLYLKPLVYAVAGKRYGERYTSSLHRLIDSSSITEKVIFSLFALLLAVSSGYLVYQLNETVSVTQAAYSGHFTEGVVGSPRSINPVLAVSDADNDLVSLVFSGLLKELPSGEFAYDLAESLTVSDDATVFTVTLKDDVVFHDGTPVTARDVAFTVEQAKNPQLRSPIQGDWAGVNVTIVDQHTVQFELDEPYAPFVENLTLGILPAHIWSSVSASQFSSNPHNDATPIGSGPYEVTDLTRDRRSALTEYELSAFDEYALGRPYISSITVRSFANEDDRIAALKRGTIDSAGGIDPRVAQELEEAGRPVTTAHLPRVFGIFLNHNEQDIFSSESLRRALSMAIDKQQIIDDVLGGYGEPIASPAPKGLVSGASIDQTAFATSSLDQAREVLIDQGWGTSTESEFLTNEDGETLSFTLTTADTPELVTVANTVRDTWREIGIDTEINVYSTSDLSQDVIRPRNYEALLFGEIIGGGRDFYPFWHSSQQSDPGLNIAQYANSDADELLEEARATVDPREQSALYQEFLEIVVADHPAVFLYTPNYIYAAPPSVQNVIMGPLVTSHSRFSLIHQWHTDTEEVWRPFANETKDRIPIPIPIHTTL